MIVGGGQILDGIVGLARISTFVQLLEIHQNVGSCELFSFLISFLREEFDMLTAIIAGDKTLQLRVFSPVGISTAEELLLTARLCKLMDRYQDQWTR